MGVESAQLRVIRVNVDEYVGWVWVGGSVQHALLLQKLVGTVLEHRCGSLASIVSGGDEVGLELGKR